MFSSIKQLKRKLKFMSDVKKLYYFPDIIKTNDRYRYSLPYSFSIKENKNFKKDISDLFEIFNENIRSPILENYIFNLIDIYSNIDILKQKDDMELHNIFDYQVNYRYSSQEKLRPIIKLNKENVIEDCIKRYISKITYKYIDYIFYKISNDYIKNNLHVIEDINNLKKMLSENIFDMEIYFKKNKFEFHKSSISFDPYYNNNCNCKSKIDFTISKNTESLMITDNISLSYYHYIIN